MSADFFLGIDIGSVTIKTAVLDRDHQLLSESYDRIKGDPQNALLERLQELEKEIPRSRIASAAVTGSGGKQAAGPLGALFVNEILAQAAFAGAYHPDTRTLIEMGGEDGKLITLARDEATGGSKIEDFSMNTACAAGTGSFLDQQAARLNLTIEQFSDLALKSKTPPRVAGRCSVFAKSDMIHLQQIATPDFDIVAGLCYAMARNFKATVGKGKKFSVPVLLLGGVAANYGMRRAFRDVLNLSEQEMTVPDHFNTSGAIGAALLAKEQRKTSSAHRGAEGLELALRDLAQRAPNTMTRLNQPLGVMPNPDQDAQLGKEGRIDAWLGVDVGSVSTNVVVIDRNRRVLSKRYLPTAGRPIEAVK